MTKWSKLKEKYGSWKMLGTDVVPLLWAEGDSLRLSLEILDEEALQQLHELDDCKEKLEALRPHLKEIQGLSPVPKIHLEALICRALWCQVWEILGVE